MPIVNFHVQDIPDGGMRGFEAGDAKVLVTRDGDAVNAFDGSCPHAGAPLADGVRCQHRIVCPWHHATFSTDDGALLEPPASHALKRYVVERRGTHCTVDTDAVEPATAAPASADIGHVLIVGGGAAGFMAAQQLRTEGHRGAITLVAPEAAAPYDRTMLSKDSLAGKADDSKLPLGGEDWASKHAISVVNAQVQQLEHDDRRVLLSGGQRLGYDVLIVATGAQAQRPDLPGVDLDGVHVLRTLDDAKALRAAFEGRHVVVVGTGFIGLEVAASIAEAGSAASVVVLGKDAQLMPGVFGAAPAKALQTLHEKHGVRIRLGVDVARLEGNGKTVKHVVLDSGERVEAGLVVLGTGAAPNDALLEAFKDADGALQVDARLQLAPGLYALGDIATAPTACGTHRIEHWRVAMQHGMVAAQALLETGTTMDQRVPFFWTKQFGKSLRYVGHAPKDAEDRLIWGEPDALKFIEFTFAGGALAAAAGCGMDAELAALDELMRLGRAPSRDEVAQGPFDLMARL